MSDDYCPHGVMRGVRCGPCEDGRAGPFVPMPLGGEEHPTPEILRENEARARYVLAYEAMKNALLAVEWSAEYGGHLQCCPSCEAASDAREPHRTDCELDATLTAAGLPDAESRDAARKEMGR